MSFEFSIPLSRDDLTKKTGIDQYVVDEVFSVRILPSKVQGIQFCYIILSNCCFPCFVKTIRLRDYFFFIKSKNIYGDLAMKLLVVSKGYPQQRKYNA